MRNHRRSLTSSWHNQPGKQGLYEGKLFAPYDAPALWLHVPLLLLRCKTISKTNESREVAANTITDLQQCYSAGNWPSWLKASFDFRKFRPAHMKDDSSNHITSIKREVHSEMLFQTLRISFLLRKTEGDTKCTK